MATEGIKMSDKKERKRLGAQWKALSEEEQVRIQYMIHSLESRTLFEEVFI